ncbi:STAS domain-containing protein [Acidicapsa dinghuensis]|uniref:STAS domain-containing protein n=1 Tax=Acidicapsa dinghuensis TaxID=2218256 RepID=A0ABW1ELL2_9BACT|nr:STAS domain-containing protein [Acidicapsa dinghuensis]
MTLVQTGKRAPFTVQRRPGKRPDTVIFHFSGPFTARDMYESLPPAALHDMLTFQSTQDERPPMLNILDLTDVLYVDSSGLGMIVRHYAHCKGKGVRFVAAGLNEKVLELFRLTKMDAIVPLAATVEDVDRA